MSCAVCNACTVFPVSEYSPFIFRPKSLTLEHGQLSFTVKPTVVLLYGQAYSSVHPFTSQLNNGWTTGMDITFKFPWRESHYHQSRDFLPSSASDPVHPLFCPAREPIRTRRSTSVEDSDDTFLKSCVLLSVFKNLAHSSNPQDHAISSAVFPELLQMLKAN